MSRIIIMFWVVIAGCASANKSTNNLMSELSELETETALIIQSSIDEYPIWSKDSNFIGCNIMGKWYKIRLTNIQLEKATWRGEQTIGVLTTQDAVSEMSEEEIKEFQANSKFQPREITTSDKTKIELKMKGFSVSLIVTKKEEKPVTLWTSELENCHSLALSPDEKYVAYLCELNGLFIMKIE